MYWWLTPTMGECLSRVFFKKSSRFFEGKKNSMDQEFFFQELRSISDYFNCSNSVQKKWFKNSGYSKKLWKIDLKIISFLLSHLAQAVYILNARKVFLKHFLTNKDCCFLQCCVFVFSLLRNFMSLLLHNYIYMLSFNNKFSRVLFKKTE